MRGSFRGNTQASTEAAEAERMSAFSEDVEERGYTPTVKAYKNEDFINSSQARLLRIMCEYEETKHRLKTQSVRATLLFFGSARAKNAEAYAAAVTEATAQVKAAEAANDTGAVKVATAKLQRVEKSEWMVEMSEKVSRLAELLTAWAVSPRCTLGREHSYAGVTRYHYTDPKYRQVAAMGSTSGSRSYSSLDPEEMAPPISPAVTHEQNVVVCTGGGPGFMEAANKGAAKVSGAKNMGMGISLPFEEGLNKYVTEELAFEYHYFFSRKFWMVYHCQALIVAPGGFGTLDELFEVLTLKQTGKIQGSLPVVLFGKQYWESILNWQVMVDMGTIAQSDVDELFFTDDPEEAFHYLVEKLSSNGNGGD
ncbi:unnamed protein product [Chrysoparadoxa australica]